jgi:MoxR-like ATPase
MEINPLADLAQKVVAEVEKAVVGKQEVLKKMLAAFLATGGHVLLEDYPGLAKTLTANSFASVLGLPFKRIQFTPDLLPGDITGGYVFDRAQSQFQLRKGPLFASIILADEINRASPRTQSALLEAMQEYQVTLEGETLRLPEPFIVIATQNPIEYEGTFPLPEAQLDRFIMRVRVGYPTEEEEDDILLRFEVANPLDTLEPVVGAEELAQLRTLVPRVHCESSLRSYVIAIVRATRRHPALQLGASPRASLMLFRAARALAAIRGRDYVLPDDVKSLAPAMLPHRLVLSSEARLRGRNVDDIVAEVMAEVAVPIEG